MISATVIPQLASSLIQRSGIARAFTRTLSTITALALIVLFSTPSYAQNRSLNLVRDAEIEHILALYAKPVFRAANLDTRVARTYLVNDPTLNAFVAGGQRVFVFTGLILRTELPRQLVGVLAHETGHIRGGHLSRTADALANAQTISIIAALLGGLAAVAAGDGRAAGALIAGGSAAGTQSFLAYSRNQESAADQASVGLMEKAGWSPRGIVEFLKVLDEQDFLVGARGSNSYLRTHPVSYERIEALETRVAASPLYDQPDPPELIRAHNLMRAKLAGFVKDPKQVLRDYPMTDTSEVARYARSVALMRLARTDQALEDIDVLIADNPDNAYFVELRGQILLEGGRVAESLAPLRAAQERIQHAAVTTMLTQALISTNTPEADTEARKLLEEVIRYESDNAGAWRQLALVHGRKGDRGMSLLAGAEQYFHSGQFDFAEEQASRALTILPNGGPDYYRALDIQNAIQTLRRRAQ